MTFEKVDSFLQRHATRIRILVIALILLYILVRVGIAHVQEYNRIQDLREQGWYLVCTCDYGDTFLMFDAKDAAELEQKTAQYENEWRPCVDEYIQKLRDHPAYVYILIPSDEIKYGKTTQCKHTGFLTNEDCRIWRDCAVQTSEWVAEE